MSGVSGKDMRRVYSFHLIVPLDLGAFVKSKIIFVLRRICNAGWMTDTDWKELEKFIQTAPDEFETEFIEKCLEVAFFSHRFFHNYANSVEENHCMVVVRNNKHIYHRTIVEL